MVFDYLMVPLEHQILCSPLLRERGLWCLDLENFHIIRYLYLFYQTNGAWVHIQLNGPWSQWKSVFSRKRVLSWGTGVPRIQTLSTCMERNLFATEKCWPVAVLLQAGFTIYICLLLVFHEVKNIDNDNMFWDREMFRTAGDLWRPTDYSIAFILSISEQYSTPDSLNSNWDFCFTIKPERLLWPILSFVHLLSCRTCSILLSGKYPVFILVSCSATVIV
jgi:hypothetical protein